MINKWKKYIIKFLMLPMFLLGLVVKSCVALCVFSYLRWLRKGIHWGTKFNTWLECQENGYRFKK